MGYAALLFLSWLGLGRPDILPFGRPLSRTVNPSLAPERLSDSILPISLPGGGVVVGLRDELVPLGPASFAWLGHVSGDETSTIALTLYRGLLSGSLRTSRGEFRVSSSGNGLYGVVEMSAEEPAERQPLPALLPNDSRAEAGDRDGTADEEARLDLLVIYTPRARRAAGSRARIESLVQLGVQETNLALERSRVGARVRLVQVQELPYVEAGRIQSDLEILKIDNDGALDEAQKLRDRYGADLVQLVVEENDGCGISYAMGAPRSAFSEWAYSVVEWSCIDATFAMAHEIGHNLGCDHAPEDPASGAAFDYSHGYKDLLWGFRTVMAYGPGRRVPRFSNPRVFLGTAPTGSETQDNARSLNDTRRAAARFRPEVPAPRVVFSSVSSDLTASLLLEPDEVPLVEWRLWLGTAPGARDVFDSGPLGRLDPARVGAPPGEPRLHARVWYRRGSVWLYEDLLFERNR